MSSGAAGCGTAGRAPGAGRGAGPAVYAHGTSDDRAGLSPPRRGPPPHSDDRARVRPTARPAQAMASANRAHTPQSASRGPMASADIEAAVCAPEIARTAH